MHVRDRSVPPRLDRRNPDAAALFESVWHEATHLLEGLGGVVRTASQRAAEARGVELAPRDLWHVVLFYTCGEVMRELGIGGPDYRPYAERNGLYQGRWAPPRDPIATHWSAYMRGEITMTEAIDRIVADLADDQ